MGAYKVWRASNGLRRDEGRPCLAHGARTGEAHPRLEQAHCLLQPRDAADQRTLSQRNARQPLRHRQASLAGGTARIHPAHRVRRLIPVRTKHTQPRRGRRNRLRHRRRKGSAELSFTRYSDPERTRPAVLAGRAT